MRFERDLHQWLVPAWKDSYIDYPRLKVAIKDNQPLSELEKIISDEIGVVESFTAQQSLNLEARIEAVNDRWGIKVGSTEAFDYLDVSRAELEALQASLVECAQEVQLLHRYVRVNLDALARILEKAAPLLDSTADTIEARAKQLSPGSWLSMLNTTLRHIRDAIKHKPNSPARSLLLERGGTHFLPADAVQWLAHDDASRLKTGLNTGYPEASPERRQVITRLLTVAAIHPSYACLEMLSRSLKSEALCEVVGHSDYLHDIINNLARLPDTDFATDVFCKLLRSMQPDALTIALGHRDQLGRLPLHHAAILGLEAISREMLTSMPEVDVSSSQDAFGKTCLDYAVEKGHASVVEILLSVSSLRDEGNSPLLATAIRSKFTDISRLLIKHGWGVHFTTRSAENALHLSAEHGLSSLISDLIGLGVKLDAQERTRGWTPLTIACVQGHDHVVSALLQAGADASIRDDKGWLAKDHAAYRGHTSIVNALPTAGSPTLSTKTPRIQSILPSQRSPGDSLIFVHLGTLDLFKPTTTPPVDISPYRRRIAPAQVFDADLSLSVSLSPTGDHHKQEYTVHLPYISDNADCQWCFTTPDPEGAVLTLKLVNTTALESKTVGTAVALLASLKGGLGQGRESLIRDFTVPLFHHRHGHVGSVLFTFLIARPYEGAVPPPAFTQKLDMEATTIIGGHRGNGWNDAAQRIQLGENTLQSFQTALDHGANLVECDVQITKDNIPVVYHDWLVSEKGCDAPVHTLSYRQLMAVSNAQSSMDQYLHGRLPWDERDRPREPVPPGRHSHRRRSLCMPAAAAMDALIDQMQHTFNYPGWKPNLRSHSVHGPFLTLEELYRDLPEGVPLHIELKYPMLSEAADFEMDPWAPEINHFVDCILATTYTHAGTRPLILTSFSPEVCILLAVKQTTYPVLFLNDSCNSPTGDRRATSLQQAVRLAARLGVAGVGMAAEPLVASPGLIPYVRGQGMYVASYGALNDEHGCSEAQAEAGIDLVIVNRVKLIKQRLDHWRLQSAAVTHT